MGWYTGAATLEYQINLHDDYEAQMAAEQEERERCIEENVDYALIPEGEYMDFGYGDGPNDLSATGDWVYLPDCDECSHEYPTIYSKKTGRLYHFNEDNNWELCSDDENYADSLADPTIPNTCPSYSEA